jgi:hypothetical protein
MTSIHLFLEGANGGKRPPAEPQAGIHGWRKQQAASEALQAVRSTDYGPRLMVLITPWVVPFTTEMVPYEALTFRALAT